MAAAMPISDCRRRRGASRACSEGSKRVRLRSVAALCLALASPLSAQPQGITTPNYAADSSWLCLPGRGDVCSTPVPTTVLNASVYGPSGTSPVAKAPPLDCFYVYPTVSSDPGLNSD